MSTQSTLTQSATDTQVRYTIHPDPHGGIQITDHQQGTTQTLSGTQHEITQREIKRILRDAGIDNAAAVANGDAQSQLEELPGTRIWLIVTGSNPVRKPHKLQAIARTIGRMSRGEVWYWHAQIEGQERPNAKTALRKLCADHL